MNDLTDSLNGLIELSPSPKDEKHKLISYKNDIKNNVSLSLDAVFAVNHNSVGKAANSLSLLRNGGGFIELKQAGFSDTIAMRDCAIYYAQVEAQRYQSELALIKITSHPSELVLFFDYLNNKGIAVPSIADLAKNIRVDNNLFSELRIWDNTRG